MPHRGTFGDARPPGLAGLALPPAPMPSRQGLRPLKAWRYVGVFAPELMLCACIARIGPARQSFWAVWDRRARRLHEGAAGGTGAPAAGGTGAPRDAGPVSLPPRALRVEAGEVAIDLALEEEPGIETVCPTGRSYAWTRKQGGVRAHGTVTLDGVPVALDACAIIDDTAGYYQRHTQWRWSAGVGELRDGRPVAWNLVAGVNDPPQDSERTVWVDGVPSEPPPSAFAADLSRVGELAFCAEAVREQRQNLLLVRSAYRQPFGTFAGRLGPELELAAGYGVMEEHDVWW